MDWLRWWQVWLSVWHQRPEPKPEPRSVDHGVDPGEMQSAWDKHIVSQRKLAEAAQRNVDEAEKLSGDLKALVDMMEQRAGRVPPSP
jgi:hypothetical protein